MDSDLPDGQPGELIDRLVVLLDQEPVEDPHWWFNYGTIAGGLTGFYGLGLPGEVARADGMAAFRAHLTKLVEDVGLEERFLVQAIVRDLDSYSTAHADTAKMDRQAAQWREALERVLDDPIERERWREQAREDGDDISDEQMMARVRELLDRPLARQTTAEDAAGRWALLNRWQEQRDTHLSEEVFEHWAVKRIARGDF